MHYVTYDNLKLTALSFRESWQSFYHKRLSFYFYLNKIDQANRGFHFLLTAYLQPYFQQTASRPFVRLRRTIRSRGTVLARRRISLDPLFIGGNKFPPKTLLFTAQMTRKTHRIHRISFSTSHNDYMLFYIAIQTKRDATKNHGFCVSFLIIKFKMVNRRSHLLEENEKRNHHHSQGNQCHEYSSLARACTEQS